MSGLFGVASRRECVEDLFYGTNYHSHLGTEFAGLAVRGRRIVKKIHEIRMSQFKSRFWSEMPHLRGTSGIGVISDRDPQPIVIDSKFGTCAIAVCGFIANSHRLARKLLSEGESFSDSFNGRINAAELAAKLINRGATIPDGIAKMFAAIEGSCTLLMLTADGIWAARDRLGYFPLTIGRAEHGWAAASETTAFPNLGFQVVRHLGPGEIVRFTPSGIAEETSPRKIRQICAFLWVYTGFPASNYEGMNVEVVRERCGRFLAKRNGVEADLVAGIPDSGTTHAIGYAMESGIPLRRPLVKYTPGFDRSYTPLTQSIRDLIAKMKLVAVREVIAGNRIVLCDDSIVRGTQLKNYTIKKLWDSGAREIHLRIACPPLMFPCRFNYSTRSAAELAARRAIRALGGDERRPAAFLQERSSQFRQMVQHIASELGVTSLAYQRLDDMVEAIGLPAQELCFYCWTGEVPPTQR